MGRNQTKSCDVCFKSMRSDNLKRHMMRRDHLTDHENDDNVITLGERLHIAAKMVFLYPELLSPSPHYPEWLNTGIEGQNEIKFPILSIADLNKCKCKYCEEDRRSECGEDQSETSDESGEDEWLDDNESIYKNDVAEENSDTQSNINK